MLTCKEISFKISESLDTKLPMSERLSMGLHLLMCVSCQRISRQMKLLHNVSQHCAILLENSSEQVKETLSEEARERILKNIIER